MATLASFDITSGVDLQEASAQLVFERQLPVAELITHRFPLEQFEQALALAARDPRIP